MKNDITYWFLYNLIDYTKEININLSHIGDYCKVFEDLNNHLDINFSFGVSDLIKFCLDKNYDFDNWYNNIDINLLKSKLLYYNYEHFNKFKKIRYIKLERDVLREAVLLYLKKNILSNCKIDNDRLLSCYRDCLLLRDVWNKYLSDYGNMYILRINLDDNNEMNLKKLKRFINMDFSVNFKSFEEMNLYKRLKNLIGNSMI